ARKKMREFVHVLFEERLELEHHPGAALRVEAGPFGKRGLRGLYGLAQFDARRERYAGGDFAGCGIEDVAKTAGAARHMAATKKMREFLHLSHRKRTKGLFIQAAGQRQCTN